MMETAQKQTSLNEIAKKLVAEKKGILAADESMGTIKKRFDAINVESTEENRRFWRELLFTTEGMEEYISGVIMFDETIRQKSGDGKPLPHVLNDKGIVPGIKVDMGKVEMANFPQEKITEGLDGLAERLKGYNELGAKFTKWRAEINITDDLPTLTCIDSNMESLARFAAISQEQGFVPIVEPEAMMKGKHTIDRSREITAAMLQSLFLRLKEHRVYYDGILLKTNMVLPGYESGEEVAPETIAEETVNLLKRFVPSEVPGVVFLSGGQSAEEAAVNLNAINQFIDTPPWELSFSFGRALQKEALKVWSGDDSKREEAQKAFLESAKMHSQARQGVLKQNND